MDPYKLKGEKEIQEFQDIVVQNKLKEIEQTIHFYKTAPLSQLLQDARNLDSATIKQIEYSAFNKVREFNTLEDDEKKLFKWKIRKGVLFNVGLLGVYKIMANPSVFNINLKYFGRITKFLTYKKGIFLWLLSPAMAHYDYQELVLRLGMKYWLIKQNQDILFNKNPVNSLLQEKSITE